MTRFWKLRIRVHILQDFSETNCRILNYLLDNSKDEWSGIYFIPKKWRFIQMRWIPILVRFSHFFCFLGSFFLWWGGTIAKYFIDVVQDSPRTGLGIPVKTKNPLYRTNTPPAEPPFAGGWSQLKVTYDSSVLRSPGIFIRGHTPVRQGRNKRNPPPNDLDSRVRPRRRTAGAGPDAISTGPPRFYALDAHRALSSPSQVWRMTRWASSSAQTGALERQSCQEWARNSLPDRGPPLQHPILRRGRVRSLHYPQGNRSSNTTCLSF